MAGMWGGGTVMDRWMAISKFAPGSPWLEDEEMSFLGGPISRGVCCQFQGPGSFLELFVSPS